MQNMVTRVDYTELYTFIFLSLFTYFEREQARTGEGQRERGWQNPKRAPHYQLRARTREQRDHDPSRNRVRCLTD